MADRRGSGVRVLVQPVGMARCLFRPAPFIEHQRRNAPQFLILFRLADVARQFEPVPVGIKEID